MHTRMHAHSYSAANEKDQNQLDHPELRRSLIVPEMPPMNTPIDAAASTSPIDRPTHKSKPSRSSVSACGTYGIQNISKPAKPACIDS